MLSDNAALDFIENLRNGLLGINVGVVLDAV